MPKMTRAVMEQKLDAVRRKYLTAGDLKGTLTEYEKLLVEAEKSGAETDALAMCCRDTADILYEVGRKEDAYEMYDRALGYSVSDVDIRAQTLHNKGLSKFQDGETDYGIELMKRSVEEASKCQYGKRCRLRKMILDNYRELLASLEKKEDLDVSLLFETEK